MKSFIQKPHSIYKSSTIQAYLKISKKILLFVAFVLSQFCVQGQTFRGAKISKADTTPSVSIRTQGAVQATALTSSRPAFEDITLHRVMLSVRTYNAEDAGTDHNVYLTLKGSERFFLNYGRDDFERGSTGFYDIITKDVNKIRDIQFLKLGITGTNALMVGEISLYLNGHLAYRKTYPNGKWIEKEGSSQSEIVIPYQELRNYSGWRYPSTTSTMWMPPTTISGYTLASFIESAVGNQVSKDGQIGWGSKGFSNTVWGKHVEMKYVNPTTIHVDLDLEKTITGPNPELDVDFDMVFSCQNGAIKIDIKNVKHGTNLWGQIQSWVRGKLKFVVCEGIAGIIPVAGSAISEPCQGYLAKFLDYKLDFTPTGSAPSNTCRTIRVNSNLSISLQ